MGSSIQQLKMKIGIVAAVTLINVLVVTMKTKRPLLFPPQFEKLKEDSNMNKITVHSDLSEWDVSSDEYPLTQIESILKRNNSLISFFLKPPVDPFDCSGCIETRGPEEDENICEERTRYISPKYATNTKEESMFIVNLEDETEFKQKVKVTMCLNPGESCGRGDLVLEGIETFCHQAFSYQKLLALSGDKKELVVDTFRFPSCCICKMRKVGF